MTRIDELTEAVERAKERQRAAWVACHESRADGAADITEFVARRAETMALMCELELRRRADVVSVTTRLRLNPVFGGQARVR